MIDSSCSETGSFSGSGTSSVDTSHVGELPLDGLEHTIGDTPLRREVGVLGFGMGLGLPKGWVGPLLFMAGSTFTMQ